MSTRSTIGIVRGYNDTARICCHSDGYVSYNGAVLQKYYNTAEKVEALLALGNLSYLGPEIGPDDPKLWDIHSDNDYRICRTYTSRGEEWSQCRADHREEYNYTFDVEEGCWIVEYEEREKPGEVSALLGFDDFYKPVRKYLIDALSECSRDEWKNMAPKNETDWGVTLAECIAAAKEARAPVNERKAREHEAWYRAYAD